MVALGLHGTETVSFEAADAMNAHMVLIGKSGSGKSTEAQKICMDLAKNEATVIVIELHNTMAQSELHPSLRNDFNSSSNVIEVYEDGISCPLLTPICFKDGSREQNLDTVSAVADVFARTYGFQCRQRAVFRKAVERVFKEGQYDDEGCIAIANCLKSMPSEVAEHVYEKSMLILEHNVFRPGNLCIEPGKINILRLGKFDLDTQSAIAEIFLSYIWRLAAGGQFKDRPLHLFCDECQNLRMGKESALSKLMTEGRKFCVNLILATQFLVKSSVEAQRILQAGLIVYFQPAQNKIRETAGIIDSSRKDVWVDFLASLKKGEFITVGPVRVGERRNDLPLKVNGWID